MTNDIHLTRALKAMALWRSKYRTLHAEATETVLVIHRNFVKTRRRAEAAEAERDAAVARVEHLKEALRGISKAVALNPCLNQAHAEAVLQAIKASADAALATASTSAPVYPYGYCPKCGAPGEYREKRPGGNDICFHGCVYPSKSALAAPPAKQVECTECKWTGPGDDVVQDVHLYCPKCGSVLLRDVAAPANKKTQKRPSHEQEENFLPDS